MSKRRKKASESKKTERKKPPEKPDKKAARKPANSKKPLISGNIFVILLMALVFVAVGFVASSMVSTGASVASGDQLIMISPPGCQNCEDMEPIFKDVASDLGIPFIKTGFAQQMTTPGFVLIHNDTLTVTGTQDEFVFKTQICMLTNNTGICEEARDLAPEEEETQQAASPQIQKSDRPEAHAFVMARCPYGLQFMKAYIPVIELLGEKADVDINFVPYLMHGEAELVDNNRIYCIQKDQNDKFTDYLRCFIENNGDHDTCVTETGIDTDSLDSCLTQLETDFEVTKTFEESTERYQPYLVDAELANVYGARGSPTFGVNGQQVRPASRSPEAIKQLICSAFNTPPEECSTTLSTSPEAPGFGALGSGGTDTDAQC